ncbi:phosphoribosylanthranilate isomerase [bacterium]|nr:phosphoribosylanthranilate isomerase [bacterium]
MSVRVKICGVTRADQAREIAAAGADYLGVVFAESPRRVDERTARQIRDAAPGVKLVGVFVDETPGRVAELVERVALDLVQLHGGESPDDFAALPVPAIKAVAVTENGSVLAEAIARVAGGAWDYLMLDSSAGGRAGGSGQAFDWVRFSDAVEPVRDRLFAAGGLAPENARAAILALSPFALDASSRLETSPGVKDLSRVRAFIDAVRKVES